jgi:protocatechuate 3,4-dioxygenase beta subunit/predicted enzyme related to lactoylglutathione lyase
MMKRCQYLVFVLGLALAGSARAAAGGNANVQPRGGGANVAVPFAASASRGAANAQMVTNSGTVLDPAGAPVTGALLSVMPASRMNMDLKSEADGKYSVTWQKPNFAGQTTFILARDLERHLAASRDLDDTAASLDLRLQPALTLSVKVQDAQGKPIPAAAAMLFIYAGNSGYVFSQTPFKADDQGLIEMKDLPQERRYSASITAKGFGSASLQAQIADTKTTHFEFPAVVLKAADRKLAGQVLGPDSKPVARANVSMQGEGQPNASATTDAQGHFAFDAVSTGPVRLFANGQGAGGAYMNGSSQAQGGDTNVVIRFGIDGVNNPNATVVTTSGTVFDPAGAPVSGARLSVVPANGTAIEVRSDDGGKYSITWQEQNFGGAGGRFIYARDAERDLALGQDIDTSTTNLDLRLQPGLTLSVKVQDAKGKPIPAATAMLAVYSGNAGGVLNQVPAKADDQGVIEIKDLPQERHYSASITAKGYGSANLQAQVGDTKTTRFQFPAVVLKAADRKLAGQVLGPDGKPVSGANVNIQNIQGDGQPNGNTRTDAQGRFAFDAVCEGPIRLFANSQGGAAGFMNGNTQAQGGDTNVVIRFGINGSVGAANAQLVTTSGTVLDSGGAPVSGARLSVMPGPGMNMEVTSGADGKYSITWQAQIAGARAGAAAAVAGRRGGAAAPAIQYLLIGRDTEHNLAAAVAIDEKATNVDLHLQTALTISGSVQDPAGAPVKNAMISLILWSGNRGSSFGQQRPGMVDAQGAFSISNLPLGQRYTMNVTATGYGSANQQVAAADTAIASLQLPPITLKVANLKLEGQVVDANDKPQPGVQVQVNGVGQPNASTTTDSKGHFAFAHVCEGAVTVFAFNQGGIAAGAMTSATARAQGGDLNVVVKFGTNPAGANVFVRQAPPRQSPPKAQPWTLAAALNWPRQHRAAVIVLLCLQATAFLGAAGTILWLTRKKGN